LVECGDCSKARAAGKPTALQTEIRNNAADCKMVLAKRAFAGVSRPVRHNSRLS
jgi:hypothetical protein